MTIYVLLLCSLAGSHGRERCVSTAFGSDLTTEACEAHRQYMEGHVKPGVTVVCRERFMAGRMETGSHVNEDHSKATSP
jgi:hypothetical protein